MCVFGICASEIKSLPIYYCLVLGCGFFGEVIFIDLWGGLLKKKNLRHTQKQFLTGNFMLRFSLQQIFRSELETLHFHYKQSKRCCSLRVLQLEENAFPSLYNKKRFCSSVQNLLPVTFGELKTKQTERLRYRCYKAVYKQNLFPFPSPLDNCSNFSSS